MQATLTQEAYIEEPGLEQGSGNHRTWFLVTLFAYTVTFVAVYLELSISLKFAIAAVLLAIQFASFRYALTILFLAVFMPFIYDLLGEGVLRFNRLALMPVLFHAFRRSNVRSFPANRQVLVLAIIAIAVIRVTADLQVIYQISEDPTHPSYNKGIQNYLAEYFDLFSALFLVYVLFTKVVVSDIRYFFRNVLWAASLQGLTIVYIAATNFEDFLAQKEGSRILWDNPWFLHKQYWGPLFCVIFLINFITYFNAHRKKLVQLVPMGIALATLFISLSRTAYLGIVIGVCFFAFRSKNLKKLFYTFGIVLLLTPVALQVDFVSDRLESMFAADDVTEFQDQSAGHFSDKALNQYVNNFTFVPQIFYTPWEFNYSEGFWNGLLHQSGILGLLIVLLVFYRLFRRCNFLYREGNATTRTLAIICITLVPLFLIMNILIRNAFLVSYYGNMTAYGLLLMMIYLYAEVTYRENVLIEERL